MGDHGDHGDHGGCEEAIQVLYQFLDGALTDEKRARISQHIDDCMPCLEAFDFEAELRVVISRRCRDEVPDSLRQRIFMAIEREGGFGGGIPTL